MPASRKVLCLLSWGRRRRGAGLAIFSCCSHAHNPLVHAWRSCLRCRYSWAFRRRSGTRWRMGRKPRQQQPWPPVRPRPQWRRRPGRPSPAPAPARRAAPPPAARTGTAPAAVAEEQPRFLPNIEGPAIQAQGGGYCFGGPHPAPGGGWEAVQNPHTHNYAPFDLRLFAFREGCYYFVGDPRDFGYTGQTYNYYGAHPDPRLLRRRVVLHGGGHYHWWRPWSPYFTVVGPWYYCTGRLRPFFWSYWPYYSFYYPSLLPVVLRGRALLQRLPRSARRSRAFRRPAGAAAAERERLARPAGWRAEQRPAAAAGTGAGGRTRAPAGGCQGAPPAGGGWRGGGAGAGRPAAQSAPPPARRRRRGSAPGGGAPAWQGGGPRVVGAGLAAGVTRRQSGGWRRRRLLGGGFRGGSPGAGLVAASDGGGGRRRLSRRRWRRLAPLSDARARPEPASSSSREGRTCRRTRTPCGDRR